MLTILEGDTFCLSDSVGDITERTHGLFANDTRMLSRLRLLVDGASPLLLTSRAVEYFNSAHYARNAPTENLESDTVSISRERFIGAAGLTERIALRNEGMVTIAFPVELELGSDFADILSVKSYDFSFGDPEHAARLPAERAPEAVSPHSLRIEDDEGYITLVTFSQPPDATPRGARYDLELAPHGRWELTVEVSFPTTDGDLSRPVPSFGSELEHVRASVQAWKLRVPRLLTDADDLRHCYHRSLADLASLRIRGLDGIGELPAAGMPWFMTVFGRDTVITSLQTLLYGPEFAAGALRALAHLQATEDIPAVDAEPGKILHELRRGRAAKTWFSVYYGTIDATPLFLVLLSELWRWAGDDALVHDLKGPALAALEWVETYGDRDGDGFLEYSRRTERGLENQSWKDSFDSQRFRDGRTAVGPIAPVEAQGYAYDARLRVAELARAVWRDEALATRLEVEAEQLQARFDEAYWIEERQTYALALDGSKAQVDSLCSNIGHLLWSGIVPEHRRDAVAEVADRRRALVGVGGPHDGSRGGCLQPAQLPQRDRLATRHGPGRVGACPGRLSRRRRAARVQPARGVVLVRLLAARGLRRLRPRRDRVPDRLPDGGATAGVGGRCARAVSDAAARAPPRPDDPQPREPRRRHPARLARGHPTRRRARVRRDVERGRLRRRSAHPAGVLAHGFRGFGRRVREWC